MCNSPEQAGTGAARQGEGQQAALSTNSQQGQQALKPIRTKEHGQGEEGS